MSTYLCDTSELQENQAREFELGDLSIILVNWRGAWHAYKNNCPHANWPLNIQPDVFFDTNRQFLQCSNHMALFNVESGECQSGPCAGDSLTRLAIEIVEDQVFVN